MWKPFYKLEIRKVSSFYFPILAVITGYLLLKTGPPGRFDVLSLMGAAQGWILAARIFSDPGGTQSFVFSRPLSHERLFLYRWGFGLILQAFTLIVVFGVIALGARQAVQVSMFRLPWYPMVKFYELRTLWSLALSSIFFYQVVMALRLRAAVLYSASSGRAHFWNNATWIFSTILAGAIAFLFSVRAGSSGMLHSSHGLLFVYVAATCILATLLSIHCYKRLEVDS